MNFTKFTVYTFLGVVPWTVGLTYLGVVVKDNWESVVGYFDVPTLVIGAVILTAGAWWYLRRRKARKNGVPDL